MSASLTDGPANDPKFELGDRVDEGYERKGLWRAVRKSNGRKVLVQRFQVGSVEEGERLLQAFERNKNHVHPALARMVEASTLSDGQIQVVYEHESGELLSNEDLMFEMTLPDLARVSDQILEALVLQHRAGATHGGINADSILIRRTGDQVNATLLDFGLKASAEGEPQADLRKLGAVFCYAVAEMDIDDTSSASAAFETALLKALQDGDEGYATAAEMRDALAASVSGAPEAEKAPATRVRSTLPGFPAMAGDAPAKKRDAGPSDDALKGLTGLTTPAPAVEPLQSESVEEIVLAESVGTEEEPEAAINRRGWLIPLLLLLAVGGVAAYFLTQGDDPKVAAKSQAATAKSQTVESTTTILAPEQQETGNANPGSVSNKAAASKELKAAKAAKTVKPQPMKASPKTVAKATPTAGTKSAGTRSVTVTPKAVVGSTAPKTVASAVQPTPTAAKSAQPVAASRVDLVIRSIPAGAGVYRDGRRVGTTPLTMSSDNSEFDIELRSAGYINRIERIRPSQAIGGRLDTTLTLVASGMASGSSIGSGTVVVQPTPKRRRRRRARRKKSTAPKTTTATPAAPASAAAKIRVLGGGDAKIEVKGKSSGTGGGKVRILEDGN